MLFLLKENSLQVTSFLSVGGCRDANRDMDGEVRGGEQKQLDSSFFVFESHVYQTALFGIIPPATVGDVFGGCAVVSGIVRRKLR